jgi:hypothetical protein
VSGLFVCLVALFDRYIYRKPSFRDWKMRTVAVVQSFISPPGDWLSEASIFWRIASSESMSGRMAPAYKHYACLGDDGKCEKRGSAENHKATAFSPFAKEEIRCVVNIDSTSKIPTVFLAGSDYDVEREIMAGHERWSTLPPLVQNRMLAGSNKKERCWRVTD